MEYGRTEAKTKDNAPYPVMHNVKATTGDILIVVRNGNAVRSAMRLQRSKCKKSAITGRFFDMQRIWAEKLCYKGAANTFDFLSPMCYHDIRI